MPGVSCMLCMKELLPNWQLRALRANKIPLQNHMSD